MSQSISELADNLPESNLTIYTLKALDFVVPGEWKNIVGFENIVREVSGETDPNFIQDVTRRANELYNDKETGYQRSMWLYNTVDRTDATLATAALTNKIGGKIPLIGSLIDSITPKPDTAQTIDLSLKVVVELLAFCYINGIPGDSIGDFVKALNEYKKDSLMRMGALVCIDGLIPLGPDFTELLMNRLKELTPSSLDGNPIFSAIQKDIPGGNTSSQLDFITETVSSVQGWLDQFVDKRNLDPQKVANGIQSFIEFSDGKLDYLGAFLDMTTNYYSHTGTQTLARRIAERAVNEI